MQLEILTPESKVFSGNVYGVQLPGVDGSFEVLDHHASLIASLKKGKMKILKDKSATESYEISSGFVEVLHNQATILLESVKAIG
jgi:F-type H+-transporting ATPase subunit epsilon